MRRLLQHLKGQSIGVAALFVALGGTGYAALNLPANSVGERQLRNHSVSAVKLDGRSIVGHVAFFGVFTAKGQVLSAYPRVHTSMFTSASSADGRSVVTGNIRVFARLPLSCALIGTENGPSELGLESVIKVHQGGSATKNSSLLQVGDFTSPGGEPFVFSVMAVCP